MKKIFLLFVFFIEVLSSRGQWIQTNGPSGGSISCITAKGTNIFVGSYSAGVFLSTDSCNTWKWKNNGLGNVNVTAIVFIDSNIFVSTYGFGVFQSIDTGENWIQKNNGLTDIYTSSMINDNGNLLVGTNSGIFISNDLGTTWQLLNDTIVTSSNSIDKIGNSIFVGTFGEGIYRSDDHGQSWIQNNNGLSGYGLKVNSFTTNGSTIIAGTQGGLYYSTNNGNSWAIDSNCSWCDGPVICNGSTILSHYGGVDSISRSPDFGNTWSRVNLNYQSAGSFYKNGSEFYLGATYDLLHSRYGAYSVGGIYKSVNDGIDWEEKNIGLINTYVYPLVSNGNRIVAGTYGGDLFISDSLFDNWTTINYRIPDGVESALYVNSNIYIGTEYHGVYKSVDNGLTWTQSSSGLPLGNDRIDALLIQGNNIFAASNTSGIFLSSDSGANWSTINNGLVTLSAHSLTSSGDSILAGMNDNDVYLTTDSGNNWSRFSIAFDHTPVSAVAICNNHLFAGTYGSGIFVYANGFVNWHHVINGLEDAQVIAFEVVNDNVFAAVNLNGVFSLYLTTDFGTTWIKIDDGLPIISLSSVNSKLYVGTTCCGVWKRDVSNIIGINEMPEKTIPFSITPNPSNGTFSLSFHQNFKSIELNIINILGETIRTEYINSTYDGFSRMIYCETKPGIYFIHITTDKFNFVDRIIIE